MSEPFQESNHLQSEVDELRQALQTQSAKLEDVMGAYSRLQQDKDDFRRRAEREKERVLEIERGNVGLALLEAVDQLDLSLQNISSSSGSASCQDCQGLSKGVRLIRDGLLRTVEQNGIARVQSVGTKFNPQRHDAAELVAVDDPALDGQVVAEIRAGYQQGERVLRPARVAVGSFGAPGGSGHTPEPKLHHSRKN